MPYLLGGWLGRKDPAGKVMDGEKLSWRPELELAVVRATIDFDFTMKQFCGGV